MAKECEFMYDDFSDRLFISCKKDSDMIAGSVRLLNLVVDFTTDNKVVNVEIIGASDYLESIGFDSSILNKLISVDLVFQQKRNGYMIYFILHSESQTQRIPYNLITENPSMINA